MIESSYLLLQLKYEKVNSQLITLTNHGQDIKQINQDTLFIYHLRSRATPSSSGWYMNGISWATIVYLLRI